MYVGTKIPSNVGRLEAMTSYTVFYYNTRMNYLAFKYN